MLSVYTDFRAQHFRLFENLAVRFSPVTIIAGKNNAGKTALLEAVFLHAAGPRAGSAALATLNPSRGTPVVLPQSSDDQTVWDSLFRNNATGDPVVLDALFSGSMMRVTLSVNESADSSTILQASGTGASETRSQELTVTTEQDGAIREYTQTVTQQFFNPQAAGPFSIQFGNLNARLDPSGDPLVQGNFMTTRTRSSQAEIAERYSDLRKLGRHGDLLNAIREVDSRLNGMEVLVREGQPMLHLDISGYDQLVPLSLFGEGMVAAIDILGLIYAKRVRVLLIDEIENGIHYSVLPNLWWHIKRAARVSNTQVIATTHSRECIIAAQGAFADEANSLRLLRLWRKSPQSDVSVTSYDFDELGSALDLGLDVR
jgi:hypothetical protein